VRVIREGGGEKIVKDGHGLGEGDAMLLEIACGFAWVMLEDKAHRDILARDQNAIPSFRLRLHSSLRQGGRVFDPALYGMAEAMPLSEAFEQGPNRQLAPRVNYSGVELEMSF
jgi:hypothetical protein